MDKNWYAIKVFFNKVFRMEDILSDMELETYLPVKKVPLKGLEHMRAAKALAQTGPYQRPDSRYIKEGPAIFERKPLVSSLIFVLADEQEIQEVDNRLKEEQTMGRTPGFIYKTADKEHFAAIPPIQMTSFKLVTQAAEGLDFFSGDTTRFQTGDRVRVIDGPLKGAEGWIKRIKKNRRLLVCVEGVVAVATSYIPEKFLQIIKDE